MNHYKHKEIYRQPAAKDVKETSQILEKAQGAKTLNEIAVTLNEIAVSITMKMIYSLLIQISKYINNNE